MDHHITLKSYVSTSVVSANNLIQRHVFKTLVNSKLCRHLRHWLRLHLALICDLYPIPDVVHIHVEKTSINAHLLGMLSDLRVLLQK